MQLKESLDWKAKVFRIFKSLRNCAFPAICGFFLLVSAVNTASAESTSAQQQTVKINGKVTDLSGDPLIGASVVEKGTSNGTMTNTDGAFTLDATPNATIEVSYLGYLSYSFKVISGTNTYNVTMKEDSKSLEEVVVVGYGVQKKKLVTGATVQVGGDDLQKLSTTNVFTAMQSQTPGVNIMQNSGQPGSSFDVNIRGKGTIGNYAPLYIIDGVPGGDISQLNPADIESMDVLKDAASAAIYGARAANGVILVTTKQGKAEKAQISYDGYYGWQNAYKMPAMLNAQQYVQVMNEVQFNEGLAPINWQNALGTLYNSVMDGTWKGTNWLDAIRVQNAPTQNHAFNMTGGNDVSKYSMGVSFAKQEGIFGQPAASDFQRTTARLNSDHVILKGKGFDIIKIGETLNYSYSERSGIATGGMYWSDIANVMRTMPIMPENNSSGGYFLYADALATGLTFSPGQANPIASMMYSTRANNISKSHNLHASANLQIQPIKNLIFKSQISYNMYAGDYREFTPTYDALSSTSAANILSTVKQTADLTWGYVWENTLNYKFAFDKNHFDALVGESVEQYGLGESLGATSGNLTFTDYQHAWLDNTQGLTAGTTSVSGAPYKDDRGNLLQGGISSFFGRINYDWNETYMLTAILRSDGSSNFAKGHRWGIFPSVSAGWVITNEQFMESSNDWLNFLKLRASWGQNGNCNILNFNYIAQITMGTGSANAGNYSFGNNKDSQTIAGYPSNIANPDVTWEKSDQIDIGLDARFLNSRLGLVFDWYRKRTLGWLVQAPVLGTYGVPSSGAPYINGGDILNKGYEVGLNWNDHSGRDFTYGINVNMSYNQNEVTRIANSEGIIHGPSNVLSQSTGEFFRVQVGYPVGYFWGYKTAGVFQNQADIDAWRQAGNGIIQPNVQPGDLKFVDLNHDGVINDKDKTKIGDPNAKFRGGFSWNVGYKGFDLSMTTYGAFAFQIAQSYRSFADSPQQNYTTDVFKRWYGEGTSNKYPRLTLGNNANYFNISDIYMHDGSYLKIQNLTLGYDFKKLFPRMPLAQARFFVTAQNLFTITGYNGVDPEIGSFTISDENYGWASNVDVGYYPSARTYLVGINLKF